MLCLLLHCTLLLQQWEVFVSQAEFWNRMHGLHQTVSLRQGTRRGWFTYEEISALLDSLPLSNLFHTIFQVSCNIHQLYVVNSYL